jgi:DNA-binding CsgD family transcriptional regulator
MPPAAKGSASLREVLGIARSTAQSHLKHIFDKTDTHQQAELAQLLARLSGTVKE